MPRFFVKIKGTPKIAEIEAATFEEVHGADTIGSILDGGFCDRVAKDAAGNEVGRFRGDTIAAWWIESGPADLKVTVKHIGQDKSGNDKQD